MCKCAFPFAERMFDHFGISFDPDWRYSFRFLFFCFLSPVTPWLESRLLLLLKKMLFCFHMCAPFDTLECLIFVNLSWQHKNYWTFLTMRCGFECLMLSLLTRSRECGTLMEQQSQTIDSAKMFDFITHSHAQKRAHHPNEPKIHRKKGLPMMRMMMGNANTSKSSYYETQIEIVIKI